jgi:dTDP-4-dehydrorhamnose reductase
MTCRSSPTFDVWVGVELSTENRRVLWIPPGFAQSFLALKDYTDFLYKCDARYAPEHEYSLARALGRAPAIWSLLTKDAIDAFYDGDAGVASWFDFVVAIQEEALALGLLNSQSRSPTIRTSAHPFSAARPGFLLLDCSKAQALLQDSQTHWRVNLRTMLKEEAALG